jgi:ApaG protein
MSDSTTNGIRVGATAFYLPDESSPDDRKFVFGYNIVIVNNSDVPARLLSRHWIIIDSHGRREDVQGPGVVGQTPRLLPGQSYKYQSYCPMKTPWGTMEGSYTFQLDDQQTFPVTIARFYLINEVPTPASV